MSPPPNELHTYSAENQPSPWLAILNGLVRYPVLIARNRGLVANFASREFHARFKGSVIGPGWALIHPLFLFGLYFVVFGLMFGQRDQAGKPPHWYTLYMFSGVLAWTVFSETAIRCCTLILENGNLIKKVAFPSELLPLPLVVVNLLVFVFGLVALYGIGFFLNGHLPGVNLLFLPLVLAIQLVFTLGIGLFLACLTVFLRDTSQIFTIVSQAWFFGSPVFWYPEMGGVREKWSIVGPILTLNPLYHLLGAHRIALGVEPGGPLELLAACGTAFVPAFLTFMLGYAFFKAYQHRFADEV
jgi:lipopolysaccharide transport system permease protein